MAYLVNSNPSIFNRLKAVLYSINPFGSSTVMLPVILANAPDSYSENQKIVYMAQGTSVGTLGNVSDKGKPNVYITAISLTGTNGVSAEGSVAISGVINGQTIQLHKAFMNDGTVSQQAFASTISFPVPVKIDLVTNNLIVTDDADSYDITVFGYQL